MKANYYIRDVRPDNSRNSWCITVLLDAGNWPERSRAHKGATVDRYRFSRTMTEEEAKATIHRYRFTFYRYQSWQDLLEDEEQILGEGHPFLEVLKEEAKKTRLIPFHRVGKQGELF